MRPRTKLNRIRFTTQETEGLADVAVKLGVPKAAIVRAFVRIGLGRTKGAELAELRVILAADVVKRGREYGYSPRKADAA